MDALAGTALIVFGGRLLAGKPRLTTVAALAATAVLICLGLLIPPAVAPGMIGLGWALSLTRRFYHLGWDLFGLGCGLLGRDLLGRTGLPELTALALVAWLLGYATAVVPSAFVEPGRQRLRWELARARKALRPRTIADAWRIRAVDALGRAADLCRSLDRPSSAVDREVRLYALTALSHGTAALAAWDSDTAHDDFAAARRALACREGTCTGGREELNQWSELIEWCDDAATFIDEEDPQ